MKRNNFRLCGRITRLRISFILLIVLNCGTITAQSLESTDSVFLLPDSVKPFTIENFYTLILQNHPLARQTELLSEVARQEIRMARGNFDPKLEAEFLTKNYNDKEYYSILNGSLKFPTTLPLDPTIGIERNKGDYLNPERYLGNEFNYQQFYAGISLPLGKGLITDDRRAALRQADLFTDMTEAEQVKLINKLLLDAAKEYWQWYNAYYNYRLLNRSVDIAAEIFKRVNMNYKFGEAAQIDTIQAKITLQQRLIEQQEAFLNYQNTGISLSTYLWDSLSNPLQLDMQWAPVLQPEPWIMTSGALEELSNQAKENHPDLQKLNVKMNQLEVERKLNAEYLKPQLNLKYYLLNQPFDPEGNSSFNAAENYKLGIDFSFPVFLRKERAKLAQTKIKLTTTQLDLALTEREILNELTSSYNQLINLQSIINQQHDMMMGYERLLNAELLNLEQGESDLFKINIQQEKLIQSQTKWLKLLAEFEIQKAFLYWAAGVRNLNVN
ncbi:MAG: TolC family protein [Cyclobacteriaceae bacterium]